MQDETGFLQHLGHPSQAMPLPSPHGPPPPACCPRGQVQAQTSAGDMELGFCGDPEPVL